VNWDQVSYGLDDDSFIPDKGWDSSLYNLYQTGSSSPSTYPVGSGCSLFRDKLAMA
jgi:hypothetical protein